MIVLSERLLVVDDEEGIRTILREALQEAGYEVTTAVHGAEALRLFTDRPCPLVITDLRMPEMDGMELLREVLARDADTAVILITAFGEVNSAVEALRRGATDYLLKPFNLGDLRLCVERALERRELLIERRLYQQTLEQTVEEQTREIRQLLELEHQRAEEINRAYLQIQSTYNDTLDALLTALDFRDNETQGHSQRVVSYCLEIGKQLALPAADLEVLRRGAMLHDIGKIGIPDAILRKPGKLTEAEWVVMRQHVAIGHRMIKDVSFLRDAALVVLHHQECFDGSGYPAGLKGEEIVLGARIFAAADTYDAMTSDRPYRKALTYEDAREEILRCSGTQFDPRVVEAFLRIPKATFQQIRDRVAVWVEERRHLLTGLSLERV
jgi:putative nucleotidyltransferase with HDIG domain